MTKIFISHSNKDTIFAKRLAQALIEKGIDVWIDKSDIRAGKIWWDEIQRGLDECDTMILILSQDAMDSRNVADEWGYYLAEEKPIFPVKWLPAKVHFRLSGLQYVDFHAQEFRAAFERLGAELRRQGISVSGSDGEMHEIRYAVATPPPTPPRIQGGEKTLPRVEDILPPPFEWVEIPGGKVTLEDNGDFDAAPGGNFEVATFKIAKYPITVEQYFAFANTGDGDADPKWWDFSEEAKNFAGFRQRPDYGNCTLCPITNITWFDAIAFCRWLSAKTGLEITLPTEKQWQRAAIGDNGWEYPWGNDFDPWIANTRESGVGQIIPVGQSSKNVSPFGVMSMSGNAWEWCVTNWPTGSSELHKTGKRCSRGGSYFDGSVYARAGYRRANSPFERADGMGFRICITPNPVRLV